MGFIDKVKNAVSQGGGEEEQDQQDDVVDEWETELDEDVEDGFEEDEAEEEEQSQEWDNPYDFSGDVLEQDGFASMKDFGDKVMFLECSRSPLFRDRIQQGAETINTVSKTVEQIRNISGEGSGRDYGELAETLSDMDKAIEAAESLSGKDDMMMQQAMSIGSDFVDALGKRQSVQQEEIDSSVTEREGEL